MAQFDSKTFPLVNRGIVQAVDPSLLNEGQFQNLLNMVSAQEGSVTTRDGSVLVTSAGTGTVNKIARLRKDGSVYYYYGNNGSVTRGSVTESGLSATAPDYWNSRWTSAAFASGRSGQSMLFLAGNAKMRKDNGSLSSFQQMGIVPPTRAAAASLSSASVSVLEDGSSSGSLTVSDPALVTVAAGSSRFSIPISASQGYQKVTLSAAQLAEIQVGTLIQVGGQDIVVDKVESDGFSAYFPASVSGTATDATVKGTMTPDASAESHVAFWRTGLSKNWAFNGRAENGYATDDKVHIAIFVTRSSKIQDLLIQIQVGGGSTWDNYYQKAIDVSTLSAVGQGSVSSQEAYTQVYNQSLGTDDFRLMFEQERGYSPDEHELWLYQQQNQYRYAPSYTQQVSPVYVSSPDTGAWIELAIPKSEFLSVGRAGAGTNSWANVTGWRVYTKLKAADPANTVEVSVSSIFAEGGEGPNSEARGAVPYSYVYCYRNPQTGQESNPSIDMIADAAVRTYRRGIQVTMQSSGDSQITGSGSIVIYRKGGTLNDGLYRFVGYAANSGGSVTFTDFAPDVNIAANRLVEFDNDPPVTADLPQALSIPLPSPVAAGAVATVNASGLQNVRVGSQVSVGNGDVFELVRVASQAGTQVTFYCQFAHQAGEIAQFSSTIGQPCSLILEAFGTLFAAGDALNPHVLYQSKPGRPEAWPVIRDGTVSAYRQPISSPSDPIVAIIEHNGEIVVQCTRTIKIVRLWQGVMQPPIDTPAQRGLSGSAAWCKADNELWYLSYDGIYSWAGGLSRKRTIAIDGIFNGKTLNGIAPLDYAKAEAVELSYYRNEILVSYIPTGSTTPRMLRYNTIYDRWSIDTVPATAMIVDDEKLYFAKTVSGNAAIYKDSGASDSGTAISYEFHTAYFVPTGPAAQSQFADVALEITSPTGSTQSVTVELYYDYAGSVFQTATITAAPGRSLYTIPLSSVSGSNDGEGKEGRAVAMRVSGSTTSGITFHAVKLASIPLAEMQKGKAYDWTDLGYSSDKRLHQLVIEYDADGATVALNLDTLSGVSGNTVTLGESASGIKFTLSGTGRTKATLPIPSDVQNVAKMVRLRPGVNSAHFKIFSYEVIAERYPADIVHFTEYSDYGYPHEKYLQELVVDVDTNNTTVPFVVEGSAGIIATFSAKTTHADRVRTYYFTGNTVAHKIRIRPTSIPTGGKFQLFDVRPKFLRADPGPVEHTLDWNSLGWPHEKLFRSVTVEYDTSGTTPPTLTVSILGGNTGNTPSDFTFTLSTSNSTSKRTKQTFQFPADTRGMMIRMWPSAGARIWGIETDRKNLPPNNVAESDWDEFGYAYEKYAEQLILEVDTGGVAASVALQSDLPTGGSTIQTFSVSTTRNDKIRILTVDPGKIGKQFRIVPTPGTGGKFQLYSWRVTWLPADKGPVLHSYDYDDLGWPYDKRLQDLSLEYEVSSDTVMNLFLVKGDGATRQEVGPYAFTLKAGGRQLENIALPDTFTVGSAEHSMEARMIRMRAVTTGVTFKAWKYQFRIEKLPPSHVKRTEETDLGYPCEKILRNVTVNMDTGGVDCRVDVEVDSVVQHSFIVNSSEHDRVRIESMPNDPDFEIVGKMFRLLFTPDTGGKSQLYEHNFDAVREPCGLTEWDSFEQVYGGAGWKHLKQVWLEYRSKEPIVVQVLTDNGQILIDKILPAHPKRLLEQFMVPMVSAGGVLNKSKSYRIRIFSADGWTPFYFYRDGSRLQTLQLSADIRAGFYQNYLWPTMGINS